MGLNFSAGRNSKVQCFFFKTERDGKIKRFTTGRDSKHSFARRDGTVNTFFHHCVL